MALFVQKGVITAPTVDGTDTVLSGLTSPKTIILWSTSQTAAGVTGEGAFCWGCFTYDGSAVQQFYNGYHSADTDASNDVAIGGGTTACLKNFLVTRAANATTNDYELRGVSMDSSSITLDWFAAPSAAIKVHYIVLGGDDLTAARVGNYTDDGATDPQDVTVVAGFGQPDLILFAGRLDSNTTVSRDAATSGGVMVGAAVKDGAERVTSIRETDAQASAVVQQQQGAFCTVEHSNSALETAVTGASAGWPTDGFEIDKTITTATSNIVFYLALKGTFKKTLASTTTLTAGGPQNLAAGFGGSTIRGALLWGWNLGTLAGLRTSDADLGQLFMGGTDGTSEGMGSMLLDDAAPNMQTDRVHSETQALVMYTPGTPTKQSSADASISGDNVVLTYDDLDSVAREFNYVILGDAAAGAAATSLPPVRRESWQRVLSRR